MGLLLHFGMSAMPVIASLYGQSSVAVGWVAHLFHSAVFGLVFVALLTRTGLRRYARTTAWTTGLGAIYGVVLGVLTGAFVLPLWVNAVSGAGLPVPLFATPAFLGHVLFGLLLGAMYAVTRGTGASDTSGASREDAEDGPATVPDPETV
jgi:uncharacterized membrane protein YagU involved in acid resistance